ncbi:tigger transposable element-derived protein 1-like [Tachyglossus aculeatus]|uniref:tigger transposable element-derived protein 1-like n=1 Tax=Tachyglossus aculeatus TaxID=9261 RepID=UPI0018F661CF|nr:tigger transposable element-derived protein 1-like [Tachyglossus aculeatus]
MSAGGSAPGPGEAKKRKSISLEQKFEVIKRYERNERTCDIIRATGFPGSTLRTIRANAEKIKESRAAATQLSARRSARARPQIIERMEKLLSVWMEAQTKRRAAMVFLTVKEKALAVHEDLRAGQPREEAPPFSASSGWFAGFKNRYGLQNVRLTGEAPSADEAAAAAFPAALREVVEAGGYSPKQIFNVDETGLFWKRLPARTAVSREEARGPGLRAARDLVTIMLGANVSGDCKLKPVLVYHAARPQALRGLVKHYFPVHFRSSRRGRITAGIFSDYFSGPLHDELRAYCERENVAFKILLVVDHAPAHPAGLAELSESIRVVFLPPNTAALLQPMDQGAIAAFKAYYLLRTLAKLSEATGGDGGPSVRDFWRSFNIRNAINLIVLAWADVPPSCLNGAWRRLLPGAVPDPRGFDEQAALLRNVRAQCVVLAKKVGFEEVEDADVEELLEARREEPSTEELLQLVEEAEAGRDEEEDAEEAPQHRLTKAVLSASLQQIERALRRLEQHDCNAERSGKIIRGVKSVLTPYTKLLREKSWQAEDWPLLAESLKVEENVCLPSSESKYPFTNPEEVYRVSTA